MSASAWNAADPGPAVGAASPRPVRLLIVGKQGLAQAIYQAFAADARFAVQALASDALDAKAKLAFDPEAVLADVNAFDGPGQFADSFSAYGGVVWALVPAGFAQRDSDVLRQVTAVQRLVEGEVNLPRLAGDLYAAVVTRRPSQGLDGAGFVTARDSAATVGWRAIAVWNPQGGVGKSTVALALALEATARRLPTLLIGMGAPDGLPLILEGIRPEPNLATWRANPTVDGLRAAVQVHKRTGQHVLVGFRDPLSVEQFDAATALATMSRLVLTVAQVGYALAIVDVSTQELAPAALSAANTLALVGRADLPGIHAVLEGLHLVKDVMAGQHAIPDGAIHLVLNRVRETTLRPEEVINLGKRERRDFPPLAAYIADDPNVEAAVNRLEPAYYRSDSLRRAANTLGDLLFPAALTASAAPAQPARVLKLGPLRIRT